MEVILHFSDTQINEDEYVRYKTGEYYKIHCEEMPKYLKEEARNEVPYHYFNEISYLERLFCLWSIIPGNKRSITLSDI